MRSAAEKRRLQPIVMRRSSYTHFASGKYSKRVLHTQCTSDRLKQATLGTEVAYDIAVKTTVFEKPVDGILINTISDYVVFGIIVH